MGDGHGMVMVWSWYGHGMVMVWSWYGHGMVTVWSYIGTQKKMGFWVGIGYLTHTQPILNIPNFFGYPPQYLPNKPFFFG